MDKAEIKAEPEVKFTYRDLKEEVNKLNEDQLDKQVFVVREDSSVKVGYLSANEQDIYSHIDDYEDSGPLQELKDLHGDEFVMEEYRLSTPKGFPLLWEDF